MKLIGLRFFSIYEEWGRPDMLILKYMIASQKKENFELFNFGNHYRDFTYIKDVVKILIDLKNKKNSNNFEIFNICSSNPIKITKIINEIKKQNISTKIIQKPLHSADVFKTYGNNKKLVHFLKKIKFTNFKIGVKNTIDWYKKNKKLFL